MSPKHKLDMGVLIRQGDGEVVYANTRARCADCTRPTHASYILVQPEDDRKFCPQCVASAFMDALPKEAQHWQPQEVLNMLNGTAEERIHAICACLKYGEKRRFRH